MVFSKSDMRRLGSTGIDVSPIGLGTVKFGRNTGVKYPTTFSLPDDADLDRLLGAATDCGINLIDTAPAYGTSEERLGKLLEGVRDKWVLSTKTGENFDGRRSSYDFSARGTMRSVEQSLRRLKTDYLDIVLVHCDDADESALRDTDVIASLQRLKDRGDILAIGASTKSVAAGLLALEVCDIVMVTYNLGDTSQLPVLDKADARNKGVLVKKALTSGHAGDPVAALHFALDHPAVASAIVGTIDENHLRGNVAAVLAADSRSNSPS